MAHPQLKFKKEMKMPIKLLSIFMLVIVSLTSCSSNKINKDSFDVKTYVTEPNKMRFSGKGAGAGMMLMSSMGPMGVAIGVAIDEGIANDIDKTANASGFNIETLILQKLSSTLKAKAQAEINEAQLANVITINILRYGFVIQPGGDDLVTPQLHMNINLNDQHWLTIKHPEQLTELQRKEIKTDTLENVKVDSEIINGLFNHAFLGIKGIINAMDKDENDTEKF